MEAALIAQVVQVLTPALPFLIDKVGGGAAAEAGKRLGTAAWELAQAVWTKMHPAIAANAAAQQVVAQVAADPADQDAQAALRFQLKTLLAADSTLAQEVASLLESSGRVGTSITVTASGERSVAIGGGISGGTIITGDSPRSPATH